MIRLFVSARIAPCSQTDRLKFRHALDVVERDGIVWHESFSPDCWLAAGQGAEVSIGHDTTAIGTVVVCAARENWHYADIVIDDPTPETLRLIRVGAPVSIGARTIRRDEDLDLRVKRHTMAQLQHIAIGAPGQLGAFPGAKITSVRAESTLASKSKPKLALAGSGVDWRTVLPRGYEVCSELDCDLEVGAELLLGNQDRGPKWDGQRFVMPFARVA